MFLPSRRILPSRREWRTVSCMRSRVRSSVDLPQPDGPMRAVTLLVAMPKLMSKRVCLAPYQKLTLEIVIRMSAGAEFSRLAAVVTGGVIFTDTACLTKAFMNYYLGTEMPRDRMARATIFMTRIKARRTRPAAHAWRCQSSYGERP